MTGLDRTQTPKTRPMPQKRTALVASLDIGTSKIACMIARLKPCPPSDALRERSHAVELIGYSQIQSRGVKAGAVVDLAECEQAVRQAVALAERMAKVRVESVLLSVAGGRLQMGAGTTTIATYAGGHFVHASGFAIGGQHVTMDLARGLSACIADAERIKTLYGTVLTGGSDARELMSVPTAGDNERDVPQIVSRATIANIVRHRVEETFEMVRDRLADSPFAAEPKARIVLSGGAAQLTGIPELATQILGRPVRLGRPLGFGRLPNEAKTASFAVPAGLLVYPQYAHLEHVEPRHTRLLRTGTDGYFGKVGRWLREGF
jgi:cell division ATPase FtsA